MVENLCKATSNWLYNEFLEDLKKGISKKLVNRIKIRLKGKPDHLADVYFDFICKI
jgi:predicted transglutaminase-like protease